MARNPSGTTHETLEERMLHRMLFFTDAVFAIVLTLLVLELTPPVGIDAAALGRGLRDVSGHLAAFGMSFWLIGVFWWAHMNTTRNLIHFDWLTAVANLVFLFPVCLIPYVSAWLVGGLGTAVTWGAYCQVLVAVSLANVLLVFVQSRGRLLAGVDSGRARLYRAARAATPGLAFALGLVALRFGRVVLAQYCWVLIPLVLTVLRFTLQPPEERAPKPSAP